MKFTLLSCFIATSLSAALANVAIAQQIDEALFDRAAPVLEDNLPPGADISDIQPPAEQEQEIAEAQAEAQVPVIQTEMMPFNSKRIDLIERLQQPLKKVVINGQSVALKHPERVKTFYTTRQYPTIWTHENQTTALLPQLQQAIESSVEDALNPASYHQSILKSLKPDTHYQDIVALELLMTDAWLYLAGDLANGLVNPKVTSPTWNAVKVTDVELANALASGVLQQNIIAPLQAFNADDPYYQALKKCYLSGKTGKTDALVINMDRIRWMAPGWYKNRFIFVNIPSYEVKVIEHGKDIYKTRSVVGRIDRQTPRFVDRMRHVVFSPTWTVPSTIMKKDKLAKLKANPSAFDGNFEVVTPGGKVVSPSSVNWSAVNPSSYSLRQKPGRNNALGQVKFLFPNKHAIYLHDTPSKGLFNQANRAKSSGCVRLADPLDFAQVLLTGTNWNSQKIKTAANQSKQQWVNTPKQTPIYLVYWTTWADTNGDIRHAKDIYKLDAKLISAYKKALTY
ncbi:L,D-transpeptidase family protein [Suttonella ornithocola]|uniref:Murein L,D-transpeptidase n=1 Tax=Suttonella ornithocola TaxID=279832 RepID=A0A380MNL0_9GAMM|nr:L,D-transpeptidase family protein [Suttonella ornithocola]SUO94220.1 murein L,D-transpeptidase [Suttonella ornithocola]